MCGSGNFTCISRKIARLYVTNLPLCNPAGFTMRVVCSKPEMTKFTSFPHCDDVYKIRFRSILR